jgi:AraC-like DNA-binding protein
MDTELYYLNSGAREYGKFPVSIQRRKYWEFQAVVAGKIAPLTEAGPDSPRASCLWIFEPEHPHGWTASSGERAEIIVFHLPAPDPILQKLVMESGGMRVLPITRADIRWLKDQRDQLQPEWAKPSDITHLKVGRLLNGLTLLALSRAGYQPRPASRDFDRERVSRALYWYRQNLYQNPGVSSVARAVGVSEVHLRRLFQKTDNASPKAAFQRIRMEQAREVLRDPRRTVEAVAAQFGFADASSFTRAYRQQFGSAPRRQA